jgi:hypothetical protein
MWCVPLSTLLRSFSRLTLLSSEENGCPTHLMLVLLTLWSENSPGEKGLCWLMSATEEKGCKVYGGVRATGRGDDDTLRRSEADIVAAVEVPPMRGMYR